MAKKSGIYTRVLRTGKYHEVVYIKIRAVKPPLEHDIGNGGGIDLEIGT